MCQFGEEPPSREENGMRDEGSDAKTIFPELAQESLLAGYQQVETRDLELHLANHSEQHHEGLGEEARNGVEGGRESFLSSASPCSFFLVIPGQ